MVPAVSGLTRAAIRRVELERLWPGAVASALNTYNRFLRQPGRWLYVPFYDCPCCDPIDARDTLDEALRSLAPRARADLNRVVMQLDVEFERRTLNDPQAHLRSAWRAFGPAWWRRRIHER